MTGKKGTVVWPAMFFEPPEKNTTRKKKVQLSDRRLKYTRFAWAGGTFFPVVLYVVSVFGSGGKKVFVQIRMYYLE